MKKNVVMSVVMLAASLALTCCAKRVVNINGIADLKGMKIGVQSGTTGDAYCSENIEGAQVAGFKSAMDAALDLKNGAIDAVVIDELPAEEIVARNSDLKIIHDPEFTANKEAYAIAVKKGNTELLNGINATIKAMKENGSYAKLTAAFMPASGSIVIPAPLSLKGNKVLKLGTNAAFPPFEYVDGKDVVGFDISMGEYIAETMGTKLEVVDMAFDSLVAAVQSGAVDFVAAGMTVNEERKKNVDFSDSYYESEQVIIVRK